MLHSLESVALNLAMTGLKKSWEVAKPLILDRELLDPPFTLNRRKGANAGRGRGYRSQSDRNPDQFRKYDVVMPRFMN